MKVSLYLFSLTFLWHCYDKYYLNTVVEDTANASVAADKVTHEVIKRAFDWAQNHIVCKEAFKSRPELLSVRMFDRFTNSNAESEHSALKKKSNNISATGSIFKLYQTIEMDAKRRDLLKKQEQHAHAGSVDTKTKCMLSRYLVKNCFFEMQYKCELAKECISKREYKTQWKVIYTRKSEFTSEPHNNFLPYMRRVRTVRLTENNYLQCSCKGYERYGYPCHHLLHVLKCYKTADIKRHWIHIRWSGFYCKYHYSKDSTSEQRKIYEQIYDGFPVGPHYVDETTPRTFPVYDAFSNSVSIRSEMFDVPSYQIMSRRNLKSVWTNVHTTTNPGIKQLLEQKTDSLLKSFVFSSSQNTLFSQPMSQPIDEYNNNEVYDNDVVRECNLVNGYPANMDYNTFKVLLQRAVELCGSNRNYKEQLHDQLSGFIHSMELKNNDNMTLIERRNHTFVASKEKGDKPNVTIISSNKVVNTTKRNVKRKKASYEK